VRSSARPQGSSEADGGDLLKFLLELLHDRESTSGMFASFLQYHHKGHTWTGIRFSGRPRAAVRKMEATSPMLEEIM